jgi:hypothetical protein
MEGSGIHDNRLSFITADVRSGSIAIYGYHASTEDGDSTLISNNTFEFIEMGADLSLGGHCSNNSFNWVVALKNPLRNGNLTPGDVYRYYNDPSTYRGRPPFADTSTYVPDEDPGPNIFQNLFASAPDDVLHVWQFPNVQNTYLTGGPP